MIDNNPLKQYFRRPAVHIKLPSGGKMYAPGVINMPESGELPVYPMTAIDEITARTPDALFNGTAVADLIKSCIPDIKDPWAINSLDLDSILIGIKAADGSSTMNIESVCPACKEEASYDINLIGILTTLKPADYSKPFETGELKVFFRPLTYREINDVSVKQFEIQKEFNTIAQLTDEKTQVERQHKALESITLLTLDLLSGTIQSIQTPATSVTDKSFILDFLKNCDRNVFIALRDYNTEIKQATELKPLDVKCIHCDHEYKQTFTLNPADFFA